LNFGNDPKHNLDTGAGTLQLLGFMGHCARLWLYWYNGQYNINLLHLHVCTCCLPVIKPVPISVWCGGGMPSTDYRCTIGR